MVNLGKRYNRIGFVLVIFASLAGVVAININFAGISALTQRASAPARVPEPKIIKVIIQPGVPPHPISPYIFGIGANLREGHNDDNVWSLHPRFMRWGGNTSERFNWRNNSWNTGSDWYFLNVSSRFPRVVDFMIQENQKHKVVSGITIPTMGWVAKDDHTSSFPVAKFPNQQATWQGHGNGVDKGGAKIKVDPRDTSVPFDSQDAEKWVKHLRSKQSGDPRFYFVGNEPMLWNTTHRDVHPEAATYDEVATKYLATAKAIRDADPDAIIVGPSLWGWLATQRSAQDLASETGSGWMKNGKDSDRRAHGNRPFLEWFIDRVLAEEKIIGKSLIDAIDVHYYPENQLVRNDRKAHEEESRDARMRATRSLWDKDYKDESWINAPIQFIPMLKSLASKKEKLGVCIGEYNFYGEKDISGAIALVEVLGIFIRQNIMCAAYWTFPPKGSPAAAAFKLLQNYDGKGGGIGQKWLQNNIEIQDAYSVLTTVTPTSLNVVVLNKSSAKAKTFDLGALYVPSKAKIEVFSIALPKAESIQRTELSSSLIHEWTVPPMSASLVVMPRK